LRVTVGGVESDGRNSAVANRESGCREAKFQELV